MNSLNFNEDFIQFVWKFSLFSKEGLQLPTGEKIQIIYPGSQNFAGGPDFFNAKIYIGATLWVGNVEIHLRLKDWHLHQHVSDAAYNNIILHVIYTNEEECVTLKSGRKVPTISIGSRIFNNTLSKFRFLNTQEKQFIPCQSIIHQLNLFTFTQYYDSLLCQRLERKVLDFEKDLYFFQGDIEAAFNLNLFKYFGAPLNKSNFELLARSFSMKQLANQSLSVMQLESFLFGLSDLLPNQSPYAKQLFTEFSYTKKLFQLKSFCKEKQWHFAGVRPQNFPTIRIAQLAALLYQKPRMFSSLIAASSLAEIRLMFNIDVSAYWQTHFSFNKESKSSAKKLSSAFIDKLIINLVAPSLFFYGKYLGEETYIEKAISYLQQTKAEKNSIVDGFAQLSLPCSNAFDSQALIELKNELCNHKKCLNCRIGFALLK